MPAPKKNLVTDIVKMGVKKAVAKKAAKTTANKAAKTASKKRTAEIKAATGKKRITSQDRKEYRGKKLNEFKTYLDKELAGYKPAKSADVAQMRAKGKRKQELDKYLTARAWKGK